MIALVFFLMMLEGDLFMGSMDEALQKAQSEEKLVMVDVYTTWCGPCKLMDRTTFKDQKVKDLLSEHFVAVKIDAEKGDGVAIARKYKVLGYPCMLILNSKGEVQDKSMGFLPARAFATWLEDNL